MLEFKLGCYREGADGWGPPGSKREREWRWEVGLGRCWADWALREKKEEGERKVGWAEFERRKKLLFFLNTNII